MNEVRPSSQLRELSRVSEDFREKTSVTIEEAAISVNETVNHPAHYKSLPATCDNCEKPIECISVVRHMNFNRGNAIKYIWRAGAKNPNTIIEDLQKAIWYLQDEITRLEQE